MIVAFGTDHGGFPLRQTLLDALADGGHHVIHCGADHLVPGDDYVTYASRVARAVARGEADRGLLLCGSGVGVVVAANKFRGVRACLCHDTFSARQGVEDDSMNVLCMGARIVGPSLARELLETFLHATFGGAERYRRRLAMIQAIEDGTLEDA